MKRSLLIVSLVILSLSVALYGCGVKKASSGSAAIETTKTMSTVDEKVNYLVAQAKAFTSSKEYSEAMVTAQYVLSNLDRNSAEARKVLEAASKEIEAQAQKAVADLKKKMSEFGK